MANTSTERIDSTDDRLLIETSPGAAAPELADDVERGLSETPKNLPPLYFYDEIGSKLFEEICLLPEYYVTRAEQSILEKYAPQIAALSTGRASLVELGSGNSSKTRLLIEELLARQGSLCYHPIDISSSMLIETSRQLLQDYQGLRVRAHVAEYSTGIRRIGETEFDQKIVLFLGSNIGNFEPRSARGFLTEIRSRLNPGDLFVLGTDMQKDVAVLEAAYDDSAGITARFNLNLLSRINRELAGEFVLDNFRHKAFYNAEEGRLEMHLESLLDQDVRIGALDRSFHFASGETIHTENSYKFSIEQVQEISRRTGFGIVRRFADERDYFNLSILTAH